MRDLAQRVHSLISRCNFSALQRHRRGMIGTALAAGAILLAFQTARGQQGPLVGLFSLIPNGVFFPNPNGASQTYSTNGGASIKPDHSSKASEPTDGVAGAVTSRATACRSRRPMLSCVSC